MGDMSRSEAILRAIAEGGGTSSLQPPMSRGEKLLYKVLERISGIKQDLPIEILTGSDYDHITGEPTIDNPVENTFYLTPSGSGDDMFEEWVYVDGRWEHFGAGGSVPQSDWAQTDSTAKDYIKNKPEVKQSDWNQTNTQAADYIKNKPTMHTLTIGAYQYNGSADVTVPIYDGSYTD